MIFTLLSLYLNDLVSKSSIHDGVGLPKIRQSIFGKEPHHQISVDVHHVVKHGPQNTLQIKKKSNILNE